MERSEQVTAPSPTPATKGNPFPFLVALLLPPIGLGLGIAWAVQGFRKAVPMLAISLPMLVLWFAGVMAYFAYYNPGTVWTVSPEDEAAAAGKQLDAGDQAGMPTKKGRKSGKKKGSQRAKEQQP